MTDTSRPDPPSPFIVEQIHHIAADRGVGARALDIATGRGRHLHALASAGFDAFGIDCSLEALQSARARLAVDRLRAHLWCADLTATPLPVRAFDLVVVTRYLQRDLFPALTAALKPGGVLLYETFTVGQLRYDRGPRAPEHLLEAGELARSVPGLETLYYVEVDAPEAVARLAAQAPSSR